MGTTSVAAEAPRQLVGCAGLQTYSSEKFNDLKKAGYSGIYYDVEVFAADATKECFAESFSNAKQAGLQVMLGTSYSAPYTSALPGDVAQGNNSKRTAPIQTNSSGRSCRTSISTCS